MKKYIGTLFAVLVLGLLIIPNFSFAQVADTDPTPSTSDCVNLQNNLRYRDRDINTNGEVSTLQDFLQSKNYLSSEPTGYFGLLTVKAVKDFQKDNNISPTGYVGPVTKAKIKALTCDSINPPIAMCDYAVPPQGCSYTQGPNYNSTTGCGMILNCIKNNNVTISGVSGPQSLDVNQSGTWTVTVTDSSGGNLSYSAVWGDEGPGMSMQSGIPVSKIQQTATFSHTYTTTGTYRPKFTVTNTSGQSAQTSLSVNVGGTTTYLPGCTSYQGFSNTTGLPCFIDTLPTTSVTSTSAVLNGNLFANAPANVFFKDPTAGTIIYSTYKTFTGAFSYTLNNLVPGTNHQYQACITLQGASYCGKMVTFSTSSDTNSSITVYSPSTGDTWVPGNSYEIRWSANPSMSILPSKVTITLNGPRPACLDAVPACKIAQRSPYVIAENISDTGSYKFNVPADLPDYYRGSSMQVTVIRDRPESSGKSGFFTITSSTTNPSVTVISPNGGERYTTGQQITVRWRSENIPASTMMAVNITSSNPTMFGFLAPNGTPNDGIETFTVGSWVNSENYTIVVGVPRDISNSDLIVYGRSAPFTITSSPISSITVLSPSEVETWTKGSTHTITWQTTPNLNNTLRYIKAIYVPTGGSIGVENSLNLLGGGSYSWTIPQDWPLTGQFKIRVGTQPEGATTIYGESPVFNISNSVVMCEYAAPMNGCSYVQGPDYVPATGCGMILNCSNNMNTISAQSANVLGAFDSLTGKPNVQVTSNTDVSLSCASGLNMTLKMGMNNSQVQCLQKLLNAKNFSVKGTEQGKETIYFDKATYDALKAFQVMNNLTADGIFGVKSKAVLLSLN